MLQTATKWYLCKISIYKTVTKMLKIGLYIHLSASLCGCALLHVRPPILYLRPSISSLRFVLLRNCRLFLVFHFPLLLIGIKYSIDVLLWKKIFFEEQIYDHICQAKRGSETFTRPDWRIIKPFGMTQTRLALC